MTKDTNINSVCKDCCFAIYENEITQVGCEQKMLDKYREITEVIEAYDDEKEFYVVRGRACPYRRSAKWRAKHADGYKEALEKENQVTVQVIVFSDGNFENVKKTVESIKNQKKLPIHLTLVQPYGEKQKLASIFTEYLKTCPFKWRLQNMLEEQPLDKIVHSLLGFIKSQYYLVLNSGEVIGENFLKQLNRLIIDDLKQFSAICDGDSSPYIIPYLIHTYWSFYGNSDLTILQNILEDNKICENKTVLPLIALQS